MRVQMRTILYLGIVNKTKLVLTDNVFQEAGRWRIPFVMRDGCDCTLKKEIKPFKYFFNGCCIDVKQLRQLNVNRISTGPKPI